MLIGLIGQIGAGKNTAANIFADNGFTIDSFAKPLKDIVSHLFQWDRKLLEGDTVESRKWRETRDDEWTKELGFPVTPRCILQLIGTELGRNIICDNFWITLLCKRSENKNIVVSDVRYENEYNAIKNKGGLIIRITRNNNVPEYYNKIKNMRNYSEIKKYMEGNYPKVHSSDYSSIHLKADYDVDNDGNIDEFREKINYIISTIYYV